jgi:hypothetical protein
LVAVVAGAFGALADILLFGELGRIFAAMFVLGCVLGAVRAHVDDLIGVVIMPPLAYAVIIIGAVFLRSPGGGGDGGLRGRAIDVGSEMILRAPALLIAFGVVVAIAVVRARREKVARRARERQRRSAAAAATRRQPPRRY